MIGVEDINGDGVVDHIIVYGSSFAHPDLIQTPKGAILVMIPFVGEAGYKAAAQVAQTIKPCLEKGIVQ